MIPRTMRMPALLPLVAVLGACATPPPTEPATRPAEVVVMKPNEAPPGAFPVPGTVWRLDERDMKALSPAPVAEPPPPPRYPPPPRAGSYPPPPPAYYYPPAYGTYWYWRGW